MRRQAKGGRRQAAGGGLRRRRNSDYYGSHRPGGPEFGATMDNVEWAMPDFYTHPEWYYHGGAADRARDRSGARVIIGTRGNPSKAVRIYRAVPRDVDTINPGDWVTQTRAYAKLHLDSVLNGDGHILSTMARAGELYNTGDSLHEWGWHPAKAENPRRKNPAGRLLQFPLREIRVEAFPSPLSNGWLLRLHINGQDVKDAVRDIKTGQARVFDSSAKAAAWWKKRGQAFVDAMGRAACVRTRKANPAWNMTRGERDVLHRVWTEVVVDGRHVDASTLTILKRLHRWGLLRASTGGWKSIPATYRISRRGQREIETEYYGPRRKRKGNPSEGERARELARELGISITKARRELSRRHRASESAGEKLARRIARETRQSSTEAATLAEVRAIIDDLSSNGWATVHQSDSGSVYLRSPGGRVLRISDHFVPLAHARGAKRRGGADAELVWTGRRGAVTPAQLRAELATILAEWGETGGRKNNPAGSPFAAEVARLRSDPTLQSASMRQHLRNVAKAPGSGRPRRSAAAREWKEFAGYEPNHVEKIDGVALKGNLPGVRVDVLEGVGAKTGRRVKIDAGQKPLYLVWFKSGERFAVTGGPSAMRELARDFSRLNEPIYLTKVDYVAPRYPVPEGVRRTKANAELSIAFTHAVENPTLMTWNGKLDPRHARFDIRVKGRRRRWVNRSGLIF